VQYVGHVALLVATGISGLQVLKNGEESLPLLVLSLLVAGLALTLSGRRERG
jgi:hypothetical protein